MDKCKGDAGGYVANFVFNIMDEAVSKIFSKISLEDSKFLIKNTEQD